MSRLARRILLAMSPRRTAHSAAPAVAADPAAPPMLRFQTALPRLPVPSLPATIQRYLASVEPHLTPAQLSRTHQAASSFLADPLVRELQARLEARAADPNTPNWLAEWWDEAAYMGYRDPIVVNVSYFYVHVCDPAVTTAAKRAAHLLKATMAFRELVETKTLEPDMVRGAPLCMDSFKWMFHASRYPTKPSDTAHKFDPATHNHVVFVRKNNFYKVPLATPQGRELSVAEIELQVERIISMAGWEKNTPVGTLTSDNRDTWTDARAELLAASPTNAASLRDIESAMVVVALDDSSPETRVDASWACWVGDGQNRWYDKHQLIVFENGASGFLGEHSCMDGTPTLRLNEFIIGSLARNQIPLGPSTADSGALPPPTPLPFVLPDAMLSAISASRARFSALTRAHELEVLHYTKYGRAQLRAARAPPDGCAQMVMQLAAHALHGRPGVCYESCATRRFARGRTEVIRPASAASAAFCAAMLDPAAPAPGADAKADGERRALLKDALAYHTEYARAAGVGMGVDRHLFGLKKCLKPGEPLPELFQDEAYARSSHWELSTSQLSSDCVDGWGYGEVVPDGYGLSYAIGDSYIRWTITTARGPGEAAALRRSLEQAADMLWAVVKDGLGDAEEGKSKAKL